MCVHMCVQREGDRERERESGGGGGGGGKVELGVRII